MWSLRVLAVVGFVLGLWSLPAHAANRGIGFSQAEEGTWYCLGDDPVKTLNCARKKCRAQSGDQECYRTNWCFSARWSGMMTVFLSEFHNTEVLCSAPSKDALLTSLKTFCLSNKYARNCSIFKVIDPAGKEHEITGNNIVGPKSN